MNATRLFSFESIKLVQTLQNEYIYIKENLLFMVKIAKGNRSKNRPGHIFVP